MGPRSCRAEYKLLGKNRVGEMAMATPAIAEGSLLLRTSGQLWRIAGRR
jgi:membrane protein implicated in regulation of membrane protease activity